MKKRMLALLLGLLCAGLTACGSTDTAAKDETPSAPTVEQPEPEPTPEEQTLRRERQEALRWAMKELRPLERQIFYRKYYYRQSTAQIAAELSLTERAVEGKLYRARQRLRKALGGGDGHA